MNDERFLADWIELGEGTYTIDLRSVSKVSFEFVKDASVVFETDTGVTCETTTGKDEYKLVKNGHDWK